MRTATMLWPGARYPSDPASNIHYWKEEAIIGNRHGVGAANEGYRGPEEFPHCHGLDQEANGQINVIAGTGGLGIPTGGTNNIYWLQNTAGVDYASVGQRYAPDNNVVYTTNVVVGAGKNILVEQYDFCPVPGALPVVTDGARTVPVQASSCDPNGYFTLHRRLPLAGTKIRPCSSAP